jgi:hypothetical protein
MKEFRAESGKHLDIRNISEYKILCWSKNKLLENGIINRWNSEDSLVKSFKSRSYP